MKSLLLATGILIFATTSTASYKTPPKVPPCNQTISVTSNGPFHYVDEWGRHSAEFSGDYRCESLKEANGVIPIKIPAIHYPVPYGYDHADGTLSINFYPGNKASLTDHIDTWMCKKNNPHECELDNTIQLAALKCNSDYTVCVTTDAATPLTFNVKW